MTDNTANTVSAQLPDFIVRYDFKSWKPETSGLGKNSNFFYAMVNQIKK